MNNRRRFFSKVSSISAGVLGGLGLAAAQTRRSPAPVPVTNLDIADLPFTTDNGVRVFHLTAEPVKQIIIPGTMAEPSISGASTAAHPPPPSRRMRATACA